MIYFGNIGDCLEGSAGVPLMTGLNELDELTGGIKPGEMAVIGGEDGVGKTALAFQIALHAARDLGIHTVYMANDMPPELLVERQFPEMFRTERNDDTLRCRKALMSVPILFEVHCNEDIESVCASIDDDFKEDEYGLVVVDSVQSIFGSRQYSGNRVWEIDHVARTLKSMAMSYGIRYVVVSHMSRPTRFNTYPYDGGISRLKDSGAIGHLADSVIVLESGRPGEEESLYMGGLVRRVSVEKARHGRTGTAEVLFKCDDALGPHFENMPHSVLSSINSFESAINEQDYENEQY